MIKNFQISLIAWLVGTCAATAQGTLNFTTRSGTTVNAPVTYEDGMLVIGTGPNAILGQLYAAPVGQTLFQVGSPTPFRSDAGAGYITTGGEIQVPGTTVGGSAQVKLVAWYANIGSTFEEAVSRNLGRGWGESPVLTVDGLGGGITPPALLAGLQGFQFISIPEPSIAPLALLGSGLLVAGRRKRK